MLKDKIERLLLLFPFFYRCTLRCKPNSNPDKYIFSKYIHKNNTVFDIGANIGLYTNFFRKLVGKNGFVHSFEPIPKTFKELKSNTKQYSSINNYRLNMTGLYDKETTSIAFIPDEISGHASVGNHSETWKSNSVQEVPIALSTLDQYFEKNNLSIVHFIKIDIEGAEINALEGAKNILKRNKPILCIEVNSELLKCFQKTPLELIEFLKSMGYQNFYHYDEIPSKPQYFEDLIKSSSEINTNIIAIP